jgi:glucosamine--fructose-6-phosphate aminotransferase (isomerizing)
MAHTRWATHGPPSTVNCHPHRSDANNEFTVVHNGIITNYKELKTVLEKKGYMFESQTDTECVAKLAKYLYDSQKGSKTLTLTSLVKAVIKELEGAFALIFKSVHFPSEIVATRRGSPLIVGVKTPKKLKVDFVDVEFGTGDAEKCTCMQSFHLGLFVSFFLCDRSERSRCRYAQPRGPATPQDASNAVSCVFE